MNEPRADAARDTAPAPPAATSRGSVLLGRLGWCAAHVVPVAATTLLVLVMAGEAGTGATALVAHLALFCGTAALEGRWMAREAARGAARGPSAGRWTGWTLAGAAVGGLLGISVLITLDGLGHEVAGSLLGVAIFGAGMAAPQARLLGAAGWPARWWIPAAAAGWLAGGAVWNAVWRSDVAREVAAAVLPLYAPSVLPGSNEVSLLATALICHGVATSLALPRPRR